MLTQRGGRPRDGFWATLPRGVLPYWAIGPGERWAGDYDVADLELFADNVEAPPRGAPVFRTPTVELDADRLVFPLRFACDKAAEYVRTCRQLRPGDL